MKQLQRGMKVLVSYYCAFHDIELTGRVTDINTTYLRLKLDDERILFDDIYSVKIIDL